MIKPQSESNINDMCFYCHQIFVYWSCMGLVTMTLNVYLYVSNDMWKNNKLNLNWFTELKSFGNKIAS